MIVNNKGEIVGYRTEQQVKRDAEFKNLSGKTKSDKINTYLNDDVGNYDVSERLKNRRMAIDRKVF